MLRKPPPLLGHLERIMKLDAAASPASAASHSSHANCAPQAIPVALCGIANLPHPLPSRRSEVELALRHLNSEQWNGADLGIANPSWKSLTLKWRSQRTTTDDRIMQSKSICLAI